MGDWRAFLRDEDDAPRVEQLCLRTRTGRPWGQGAFLDRLGALLGRRLHRQKPGPKPKMKGRKAYVPWRLDGGPNDERVCRPAISTAIED
ncbi:MAG: hypothetical protein ABFD85_07655 [Phycisphaerae bacterium]